MGLVLQEMIHLRDYVAHHGRQLHALRFAVHVHQTHPATGMPGHHLHAV